MKLARRKNKVSKKTVRAAGNFLRRIPGTVNCGPWTCTPTGYSRSGKSFRQL